MIRFKHWLEQKRKRSQEGLVGLDHPVEHNRRCRTFLGESPHALPELAQAVSLLPRLQLRGLMTIPEPADAEAQMRAVHRQAKALFSQLCAQGLALDTLSMGMSTDLSAAIAEGSTMVRVGTAIFGKR